MWSIVCGVKVMLMRGGIVCLGCVWFRREVVVDACGGGAGAIKVKSGGAADNVCDDGGDVWGGGVCGGGSQCGKVLVLPGVGEFVRLFLQ